MRIQLERNLKHNLIVNLTDGSFFGLALGLASFVTVVPLFISQLTDSAILIGLPPAIHSVGWQLPQLFLAGRVSRQRQFRPMVMWMTLHERMPFLFLALIAWSLPSLDKRLALTLTFLTLTWQGLGGGFTANAWQSMIAKIIPSGRRGSFFGAQASFANLLSSGGAVLAGVILERLGTPVDFALIFLLAGAAMLVSMVFLGMTREPVSDPAPAGSAVPLHRLIMPILRENGNFRWFLIGRILAQVGVMAIGFYTVYAVRRLGLSDLGVGLMTGVFTGVQILANPLVGWIGDRWGHRPAMVAGGFTAMASAIIAWWAPTAAWFYLAYALAGVANVSLWTSSMAMTLEFGQEHERPAYIGLANTLTAPATILAPIFGGWLADRSGYPAAFLAAAVGGLLALLVLQFFVRDPVCHGEACPEPVPAD